MRSLLDVKRGVQEPTIVHLPPDVVSLAAAEEAIDLADAYGVCDGHPLSESQAFTLRAGLGERVDGSWAATTVADFKARQGGGKSDTIIARELAGLRLFKERLIIHTAHEFPTANESFLRLAGLFTEWDDLRKLVKRIFYGNGTQSISFLSGQRILYRARTGGSGRGFAKASLVVYDEAQHVQAEHIAASGPARAANPNSQSWYAGSGGLETSANAWRLRRLALAGGAGRLAYVENTAEDVRLVDGRIVSVRPDVDDREAWFRAIPGLGRWVTEETLEGLRGELGDELFTREFLCVWDPEPGDDGGAVIPADVWAALADRESKIVSHRNIALEVSPDRQWATFGAAGRRADGRVHVEAFDRRRGTGWVLERGVELHAKWKVPIRIEKTSPAAAFIAPLTEAGVEVEEVSSMEHAQAVGQFIDSASNDVLRHLGGSSLDAALRGAVLRPSGDTQLWGRRQSKADITPLVAVTIALGGVPAETPEWSGPLVAVT